MMFRSKEELRGQVIHALVDAWPPSPPDSDPIPKPPAFYAEPRYIVAQEFVGREPQLGILSKWAMPSDSHTILLFEAIGGNGKSMLTWEWTTKYATSVRDDWAGRFWYSFYEKGAVMADFCQRALAYMTGRSLKAFQGIKTPELTERLLHYLQERPWLFVLDGLERVLVAYHRIDAAEVPDEEVNRPTDKIAHRDPCSAIRPEDDDLLRALAAASPSKLLVSSRLVPKALLNKANRPITGVMPLNLPGLLPPDAEKLFRSFGITGNSRAIQNYLDTHCKCHPLVIGVLAGLINDYLTDPGNFDAWATDSTGGNQLNLANLDLTQKRNHILKAGLAALPEKSNQLLSTLALVSESVDYQTLCAFNPHLPPEPEKVEIPTKPEHWGWDRMSDQEKEELRTRYAGASQRRQEYELAVKARLESPEFLAAPHELEKTVGDLVRRGLLQYDGRVKRYDLHPVVRGVASGGLQAAERDRYGQQVVDYFSHQSHNPYEQAESIEDLRAGLEVVRTLLKLKHFQRAADAYCGDFALALYTNLEAHAETLALLRPFFASGWGTLPSSLDKRTGCHLLTMAGHALSRTGFLNEALSAYGASLQASLKGANWHEVTIGLRSLSMVLADLLQLSRAIRTIRAALDIAGLIDSKERIFMSQLETFRYCSVIGQCAEAEDSWRVLDPMGRDWLRRAYRPGRAELYFAQFHFWKGDLQETHLTAAEQLARDGKNRIDLREIKALSGAWRLEREEWRLAAEDLHEAVQMARAMGMLTVESETQLALARLRLGLLHDPRREAECLAEARKPAHRVLAELWLAIGDGELAKKHALEAYKLAWAYGEPYVHRYELNKAIAILRQLGVQTPKLSPYDAGKDEKLPWEDEVASAIARLRAEKEAKQDKMPDSDAPPADDSGNDRFSFGKVVRATDSGLTLLEYDFATDTDKEIEYVVNPETEYGNVENLASLRQGDDVVLDYIESEGKRVITTLVKEEKQEQL